MRGHDLFIEKPPGVTVFQTECLARAAALKKAITGVGFQRRYHPLFLRCREEVVRHGPVNQVVAAFYKLQPPGEPYPYYRGAIDILTCDAIHALDMCRFYAGGEVRAVASDVQRIDQPWPMSWNAVISFDNGVTAVLLANWRTGGRRLTLELHAAGCSAFANADGAAEVIADNQPAPVRRWSHIEAAGSDKTHIHQGYLNQARAFIDAVKSRRELHNSIADTVKTMRLVEQVYGSAI
jgi:predicted dehydrogenase